MLLFVIQYRVQGLVEIIIIIDFVILFYPEVRIMDRIARLVYRLRSRCKAAQ